MRVRLAPPGLLPGERNYDSHKGKVPDQTVEPQIRVVSGDSVA